MPAAESEVGKRRELRSGGKLRRHLELVRQRLLLAADLKILGFFQELAHAS